VKTALSKSANSNRETAFSIYAWFETELHKKDNTERGDDANAIQPIIIQT